MDLLRLYGRQRIRGGSLMCYYCRDVDHKCSCLCDYPKINAVTEVCEDCRHVVPTEFWNYDDDDEEDDF